MDEKTSGRDKLWGMVKKYRFAMLTTRHAGGGLRSRPMTTIEHDADDSLWFFARADSAAAQALASHQEVCLSYADADGKDFVCVAGDGHVVTDVNKKISLWNPMVDAWMPEGAESPAVVLVKVAPDHAEYWDSTLSKLVELFSMAKALATGVPPRDLGEHRDVPVRRPS